MAQACGRMGSGRGSYDLSRDEERRVRGFRTNILENVEAGLSPRQSSWCRESGQSAISILRLPGHCRDEAATDAHPGRVPGTWLKAEARLCPSRLGGLHAADTDNSRSGAWSMIPLIKNGALVEQFASRCPQTMQFARKLDLPKLGLISPSLYFSVLEPNSRIAPHTGITNARLIAHLPLIVPGECGFRVGGEERRWEVGKALVFDDMTLHEAWNESDRIRVVLIADLWRPELSGAERAAVSDLMNCQDVGGSCLAAVAVEIVCGGEQLAAREIPVDQIVISLSTMASVPTSVPTSSRRSSKLIRSPHATRCSIAARSATRIRRRRRAEDEGSLPAKLAAADAPARASRRRRNGRRAARQCRANRFLSWRTKSSVRSIVSGRAM